jgi:hypothetical protein
VHPNKQNFWHSLALLAIVYGLSSPSVRPQTAQPVPIWDGNDGLQPPLQLKVCEYLTKPFALEARDPQEPILWRTSEAWYAKDRSIHIERGLLTSHAGAVACAARGLSGSNLFFHYAGGKWDPQPAVGSHSVLRSQSSQLGEDRIVYIQGQEYVFITYRHKGFNGTDYSDRMVQIAKVVQAKIRASGESGPEPDSVPPTLTVSATPSRLWPPNKKMVKITISINAQDNSNVTPTVSLVSVTSSAGGTADISIGSDGSISLRATRAGNESQRTYTITYKATDGSGNSTNASTTVIVPHDQGH